MKHNVKWGRLTVTDGCLTTGLAASEHQKKCMCHVAHKGSCLGSMKTGVSWCRKREVVAWDVRCAATQWLGQMAVARPCGGGTAVWRWHGRMAVARPYGGGTAVWRWHGPSGNYVCVHQGRSPLIGAWGVAARSTWHQSGSMCVRWQPGAGGNERACSAGCAVQGLKCRATLKYSSGSKGKGSSNTLGSG